MNLVVQGPAMSEPEALEAARLAGSTRMHRIAERAWRIHGASPTQALPSYCVAHRIDFAFVPEERRFADLKLLAMDMDSTLITIECIDELADFAGRKAEVAAITGQAMRGELDYPQSLRKRVAVLEGLDAAVLERVYAERLRLTPGAEALVARCKAHGVRLLLVSGGFSFFTERLRERLALDYTIANRLEVAAGRLTGRLAGEIVDADAKARRFAEVARELGAGKAQTVALGDGANDLKMMAQAGYSVAFRAKPSVRAQASCAIDWCGLDAVINLFE
ncbi:MAG TPA: phosphoserine phosphatase SerB [Burkholderiales bacterium]